MAMWKWFAVGYATHKIRTPQKQQPSVVEQMQQQERIEKELKTVLTAPPQAILFAISCISAIGALCMGYKWLAVLCGCICVACIVLQLRNDAKEMSRSEPLTTQQPDVQRETTEDTAVFL